jgi:hypothetical protein
MCVLLLQFAKFCLKRKKYTSDIVSTPTRIFELREVIADLDDAISQVVE